MKSLYKILLLTTFLISSASSCEEEDVNVMLQDMAKLDSAFIPVLFYVRNGEMQNAKKSVFYLNHNWQIFENKYKNVLPENDDWQENFRMTSAWLSDAYTSIDANAALDAYIYLDHVRYQMIELREQHQLDYFLDGVWEFEARLDVVEEVAVDQMLCLLDFCEFEKLVADMNEAWDEIKIEKKDLALLEMDEDKLKFLRFHKGKLKDAIHDFNFAVEEAEGESLAIAATFLKVAYLEYLSSFGDFISSKSYYATL